mmetsp:Transcript_24361/g.66113  ORF Transcript_24361/g.66113 Transcript_24361/m.66113 type:complete len:292 (+) Transcript_24361:247-1122(+)
MGAAARSACTAMALARSHAPTWRGHLDASSCAASAALDGSRATASSAAAHAAAALTPACCREKATLHSAREAGLPSAVTRSTRCASKTARTAGARGRVPPSRAGASLAPPAAAAPELASAPGPRAANSSAFKKRRMMARCTPGSAGAILAARLAARRARSSVPRRVCTAQARRCVSRCPAECACSVASRLHASASGVSVAASFAPSGSSSAGRLSPSPLPPLPLASLATAASLAAFSPLRLAASRAAAFLALDANFLRSASSRAPPDSAPAPALPSAPGEAPLDLESWIWR